MSNTSRSNTKRTGLIGLVLTAAVVVAAQNFDKLPILNSSTTYSAYFADSGGLAEGDKVMVAGVQVGEVQDIDLEGDRVKIEFTGDGNGLGTATEAAIKTRTVLGNKYLQVTPRGDEKLADGQAIPLEQTTPPYLLTDALGDLTTTISGLDTDQVTNALGTISETLNATAPNLSAALDGVSQFSESIGSRDELLQQLFQNTESLTGVLGQRSQQINSLLLDGNTLFTALNQRRQAIDTLLGNLEAVSAQVTALVDDNEAQLRPVLDELNSTTALLHQHKDNIGRSILPLGQYTTSLGESVASGPFFKAYVMNLLPGQFLQPFIDAAFKEEGIDPGTLNGQHTFPVTCGENGLPGTIPPGSAGPLPNPSDCPIVPGSIPGSAGTPAATVPAPAPANPGLPGLPSIPGLPPLPGLGG